MDNYLFNYVIRNEAFSTYTQPKWIHSIITINFFRMYYTDQNALQKNNGENEGQTLGWLIWISQLYVLAALNI